MSSSADRAAGPRLVVYLVRSWPRLSQTFVLDEVLGLERLGVRTRIVALSSPAEARRQAELGDVAADVTYLDRHAGAAGPLGEHLAALAASPRRYLRAALHALRRREWDSGYHNASRARCLTYAVRLARALRREGAVTPGSVHLHAHFAHDPAAVASLTHLLTGLPWSFTAHARDLWQVAPSALAERVGSARTAVTCCRAGHDYLSGLVGAELRSRVRLVHHGVDVETFRPSPTRGSRPDRSGTQVVSVGRLVEKKGFADLLAAYREVLDRGHRFHATVYGDGPLRARLDEQVHRLGLSEVVTFAGERTRRELLPALQRADVFALTPFVTVDGDRDGIPNVLVEAMACGLPVVATETGGIPELVHDGVDGLLAPARDVAAIADRLCTVLGDAALRDRLGAAARRTVLAGFDSRAAGVELARLFDHARPGPP